MRSSFGIKILWLLIASMFFVSCFKDEVDYVGYGDAYVIVEKSGENVVKGLGLHAFSYSDFSGVKVAIPGSTSDSVQLTSYLGYKQDYFWETPDEEFGTATPPAGDYVFSAVFADGHKLVFSNKLTSATILPPLIKMAEYVVSGEKVDTEWEIVSNADIYNVKLINDEEKVIYVSPELNAFATNWSFGKNTNGWQTNVYPVSGQILKVVVTAYLMEDGNSMGRLQAISRSESQIVWGN